MGRDFVFTNSNSNRLGSKKRTISRRFSVGPKASRFVAVIVFAALGVIYLAQSTQGADRSYKVRDLVTEKTQLLEERDRLKIEESRLESLNEIDKSLDPESSSIENEKLVPATKVNYLSTDKRAAVAN